MGGGSGAGLGASGGGSGAGLGTGRTGGDYLAEIASLSGKARENTTLEYVRERWLPDSLLAFTEWPVVILSGVDAAGGKHTLEVQVSPDALRVGVDESTAATAGAWPTTAQKIADELGLRTVGKKLTREIFRQAAIKGNLDLANPGEPYYDLKKHIPRNIEDSRAWAASDKKRNAWRQAQLGGRSRVRTLISGDGKGVVHQASAFSPGSSPPASPSGSKLAIYGGGGGSNDGWAIQPFPGPHAYNYGPDYSHEVRFARNRARLDGKADKLDRIAADPVLYTLLSEGKPYNNRMSFPPSGLSIEGDMDLEPYVPTGRTMDSDADDVVVVPPAEPPALSGFWSDLFWWLPVGGTAVGLVWAARRGIDRGR